MQNEIQQNEPKNPKTGRAGEEKQGTDALYAKDSDLDAFEASENRILLIFSRNAEI